jgi:hypothetical protein
MAGRVFLGTAALRRRGAGGALVGMCVCLGTTMPQCETLGMCVCVCGGGGGCFVGARRGWVRARVTHRATSPPRPPAAHPNTPWRCTRLDSSATAALASSALSLPSAPAGGAHGARCDAPPRRTPEIGAHPPQAGRPQPAGPRPRPRTSERVVGLLQQRKRRRQSGRMASHRELSARRGSRGPACDAGLALLLTCRRPRAGAGGCHLPDRFQDFACNSMTSRPSSPH